MGLTSYQIYIYSGSVIGWAQRWRVITLSLIILLKGRSNKKTINVDPSIIPQIFGFYTQRFLKVPVRKRWDLFYCPYKILCVPHRTIGIFKPKWLILTGRKCLLENKTTVDFQCSNWVEFLDLWWQEMLLIRRWEQKVCFFITLVVLACGFSFTLTFCDFFENLLLQQKTHDHLFPNSRKDPLQTFPLL